MQARTARFVRGRIISTTILHASVRSAPHYVSQARTCGRRDADRGFSRPPCLPIVGVLARAGERLLFRPNASGPVSVCLAYPNTWAVAMANLGFQAVYRILATTPGIVCERVFLTEDGSRAVTEESGRSPSEFDILAFSLSFESDYPNIVRMLDAAGIPVRSESRRNDGDPGKRRASARGWPLLIAGGPATFLNPEPVAPFFDLFLIGEGEEMIPEAFACASEWQGLSREKI